MSDTPITPPEDDDLLAAEMALGLLEGEDRAAARARLMQDRDFARSVADWQERFVAMTDDIAPVAPPAKLREGILVKGR